MAPRTAALALAVLGLLLAAAPRAGAQEPCSRHELRTSDTLAGIAARLGIEGGARALYEANRDVLPAPDIFIPGTVIVIPCADGTLPGQGAPASGPSPLPQIRFLTGGRYAPFTDRNAPNGGMITEMVETAMRLGDPRQDYRIDFVNDWGAHLESLLPSGAFDMGFPWFLPDCTRLANLGPGNARRCTDFRASLPLFEAEVSYYTLKGHPLAAATAFPDLLGARLCRPDGWFTFDLEAQRLVEPNVAMTVAPTQVRCWQALLAGEVDVVTFDRLPAEADIAALGIADRVVELPRLATVIGMHVLTPRSNPNGEAFLAVLDRGLTELRRSGRWREIVEKHLGPEEAARIAGR
ncbi:MAG: transporter substrate-binding domain-containing protein [Rhodobacteraceae bacterium]|nr:transporter substrate-binding domain-containing protein [Paracoccaceae bacterium]